LAWKDGEKGGGKIFSRFGRGGNNAKLRRTPKKRGGDTPTKAKRKSGAKQNCAKKAT